MAKCAGCGAEFPNQSDLTRLQGNSGAPVLLCSGCIRKSKRKSKNSNTDAPGAGENASATDDRSDHSGRTGRAMRREEEAAFSRLQETLDQIAQNRVEEEEESQRRERRSGQKRAYERHNVELNMEFSFLRDSEIHSASVLDISQGGLRFSTEREVASGQLLRTVVFSPGESRAKPKVKNLIEVRRVVRNEEGLYIAGARFVRRTGLETDNRRRHKRRSLTAPVFYRRQSSDLIHQAKAVDISQGGLRILANEPFRVGEIVDVMLRTQPPAFVNADLRGAIRIVRINERDNTRFETGGEFVKLQVHSIDKDKDAQIQ